MSYRRALHPLQALLVVAAAAALFAAVAPAGDRNRFASPRFEAMLRNP